MRSEIPQWVISWCATWGRQKRRIWTGKDWYIDSTGKRRENIDGYAQSLLGRIREERDGAAQVQLKQHWAEVFWGPGLEVQRAIPGMREVPFCVGHLRYVWLPEWQMTVPEKAALIGITKAEYWRELENFETWVHAKLDSVSPCQPSEKPLQPLIESFTLPPYQPQNRQKCRKIELNLAALNRPKLVLNTDE